MTLQEIAAMIAALGLPYAYHHFDVTAEHPAPAPPFICFFLPRSDDFFADNANYVGISELSVELYSANKDFENEARIEAALTAHGLPWEKEETYLDGEKLYMTSWDCEAVLRKGDTNGE